MAASALYYEPSKAELRPYSKKSKEKFAYSDSQYLEYRFSSVLSLEQFNPPPPRSPANPKSPSLYSIPPEVRLQIFELLLTSDNPIQIYLEGTHGLGCLKHTGFSNGIVGAIKVSRGLFFTSRRISDEALSVLYANKFHIKLNHNCTRLWLLSIGSANRNRIIRLGITTWPGRGYGNEWHLHREFEKLADDFSNLPKLRCVEYQLVYKKIPEGSYDPNYGLRHQLQLPTEITQFDVPCHAFSDFHKKLLIDYNLYHLEDRFKYTHRLLRSDDLVWVTATITHPPKVPPLPKHHQPNSPLLALPPHIIRKILEYCQQTEQVTIVGPLNFLNAYIARPGYTYSGERPFECLNLFRVCKTVSAVMRETMYSRISFIFQDAALNTIDMLNPQDFAWIQRLEVQIGFPTHERQIISQLMAIKCVIHRLLQPSSNIKRFDIRIVRLSTPCLHPLRQMLCALREKCQVKVTMIDHWGADTSLHQNITWMLNTDPKIIWAWEYQSDGWKDLKSIEQRVRREDVKRGRQVLVGAGGPIYQQDTGLRKVFRMIGIN
ncbi:hypothetical protein ABW19_dt0201290 [Dactylella cylindrospora]|nr:hypothetical protein ABW19_dt0201290 [Dactylella cylindrospora]